MKAYRGNEFSKWENLRTNIEIFNNSAGSYKVDDVIVKWECSSALNTTKPESFSSTITQKGALKETKKIYRIK